MILFVVILGLCVGSFLNVCIYRIPRNESIVFPASHCTNCGHTIKKYDLLPIISYIVLKGRCRNCKSKISPIYPLIEVLNTIIYIGLYFKFGFSFSFFKFAVLTSALIVIGVIDFFTSYVYLKTVVFTGVLGLSCFIYQWIYTGNLPIDLLYAAVLGFFIIYIIVKLTKGMGEGDIEIISLCGLFLGVRYLLLEVFLAFILGALVGSILIILKLKNKKEVISFTPYIALSVLITIFYGNDLINWYLGMI